MNAIDSRSVLQLAVRGKGSKVKGSIRIYLGEVSIDAWVTKVNFFGGIVSKYPWKYRVLVEVAVSPSWGGWALVRVTNEIRDSPAIVLR